MRPIRTLALLTMASVCWADPPSPADDAKRKAEWEAKTAGLNAAVTCDDLRTQIDRLRARQPHVRDSPWGSTGWAQGCGSWTGSRIELDGDWAVLQLRDPPADPGRLTVTGRESGVSLRIVGFPDLRQRIHPEMYDAVRAIHQTPTGTDEFDPINLIRAVNVLLALGPDRATNALHEYVRLCREARCDWWQNLDDERVSWICALLFVPKDAKEPMRLPGIGGPGIVPKSGRTKWPLFPLVVEGGIPFCVMTGSASTGPPPFLDAHIDWCKTNCRLRGQPLVPSVDPFAAIDTLMKSDLWDDLDDHDRGKPVEIIREQAALAASGVVALPEDPMWRWNIGNGKPSAEWSGIAAQFREAKPKWDPAKQDYVATVKPASR